MTALREIRARGQRALERGLEAEACDRLTLATKIPGRIAANRAARFLNARPPFSRRPADRLARWIYFRAS